MKKCLLSVGFIIAVLSVNGVNNNQRILVMPTFGNPLFVVEGIYTPFFVGRNLATTSLEKSFIETYAHEYSWSAGVNAGWYAGKHIQIQTGAWYSPRNYICKTEGTFSAGYGSVVSRYMPTYVSVPLAFKIVLREKVSPFLKIGALADMLMSYSGQSNFYGSATFDDMAAYTKTKEQFEKTRFSLIMSFGLTMGNLYKNSMYIQFEPTFIYSLSNDAEVLSSSYRPFYYGFSFTLGYVFVKHQRERDYELPDEIEFEEAE
jgi:hypothetical protein